MSQLQKIYNFSFHFSVMLSVVRVVMILLIILGLFPQPVQANEIDIDTLTEKKPKGQHALKPTSLIVPVVLVTYGFAALNNPSLKEIDESVHQMVFVDNPHAAFRLDDYLQYAPAVAVYGLNLAGIKGRHNFIDRTVMLLLANQIANLAVYNLKDATHRLRPDSSTYRSFPSGHTAKVFATAEFLRQEYNQLSPWYSVAAYTVASGTGFLRIYNNNHWLSDVLAGAGIGILSTQAAYFIYPKVKRLFVKKKNPNSFIAPIYTDGCVGFTYMCTF